MTYKRFDDFKKRKNRQQIIISSFKQIDGLESYSHSLETCGDYISVLECRKCKSKHFVGFNRCKLRFCINCSHIKLLCWVSRVLQIMNLDSNSDLKYSMLTLTLRDCDDLDYMINYLRSSWRALYHDDKLISKEFKRRFVAGIKSIEIKKGKNSGKWHVHFHCIVATVGYSKGDYDFICSSWKKVTKGNGSVFIRRIYNSASSSYIGAVCECLKYIVKFEDSLFSDVEVVKELYYATKGLRQVSTWGRFYGCMKSVQIMEDSWEDEKIKNFVCSVCGCTEADLKYIFYENLKDINLLD